MLRAVLLLSAILSAGLLSGPADARSRAKRDDPQQQQQQQERKEERREEREPRREERRHRRDDSADAGRRAVARNGGGRVLSVEPDGAGYRVKVIKDGEVRMHHIEDN